MRRLGQPLPGQLFRSQFENKQDAKSCEYLAFLEFLAVAESKSLGIGNPFENSRFAMRLQNACRRWVTARDETLPR
jgi:hypothetical protein